MTARLSAVGQFDTRPLTWGKLYHLLPEQVRIPATCPPVIWCILLYIFFNYSNLIIIVFLYLFSTIAGDLSHGHFIYTITTSLMFHTNQKPWIQANVATFPSISLYFIVRIQPSSCFSSLNRGSGSSCNIGLLPKSGHRCAHNCCGTTA